MARKPRRERSRPTDWKLAAFPKEGDEKDEKFQNKDGHWRVVDGSNRTVAICSSEIVTAIFAHRHLLAIGKVSHEVLKGLNALRADWMNVEHILKTADPEIIKEAQEDALTATVSLPQILPPQIETMEEEIKALKEKDSDNQLPPSA